MFVEQVEPANAVKDAGRRRTTNANVARVAMGMENARYCRELSGTIPAPIMEPVRDVEEVENDEN